MSRFKDVYDEYKEKIKDMLIEKVHDGLTADLAAKADDVYGTIGVLGAYHDHLNGKSDLYAGFCYNSIAKLINDNKLLDGDFDTIKDDPTLTDLILRACPDETIIEFLGQARKRKLKDPSYNEIFEKVKSEFESRGLTIDMAPERYTVVNEEKKNVSSQVDDINREEFRKTVDEYTGDSDKTILVDENTVIKRANKQVSSDGSKKVIMTFTIDPSMKEHKRVNSPIATSLAKGRLHKLYKAMDRYMKWLEKTDLKIETKEVIGEDGRKVTNVHIKSGKVYNLTATCKNKTKEAINRHARVIEKARKRCGDLRKGIAKGLKKIIGEDKMAKVANAAGNVASKVSENAKDFATRTYEKVDKMLVGSPDTLERMKEKRVVGKSGAPVATTDALTSSDDDLGSTSAGSLSV